MYLKYRNVSDFKFFNLIYKEERICFIYCLLKTWSAVCERKDGTVK
jgi:hypothetical protein